jgi:hypothetical protein
MPPQKGRHFILYLKIYKMISMKKHIFKYFHINGIQMLIKLSYIKQ